jgi:diguanylate cyclase (GGDEF)-like protein
VKKAKKDLGAGGFDGGEGVQQGEGVREGDDTAPVSPDAATGGGPDRSVETMLQEISGGAETAPTTKNTPRLGKYDQLWQLSMADPHTGLANQLLLLDRLSQALVRRRRHGGDVLVCHIKLDNLAEINAELGYTTGNAVLCDMSRRLTSVLRDEDTVGRVGSSELVAVITVNDEQAVGPLMRRLQHNLDEPVLVGDKGIRLRASLGVAVAEDSESAEEVLARADRSTRVSKR